MGNLAELFKPADPRELYAYNKANETRLSAKRLDELYRYARDPNFDQQQQFDRFGQATGRRAPQQDYCVLDQADATRRHQISLASGDRRRMAGGEF